MVPAASPSSSISASPATAAAIQSTTVLWLRWSCPSALPRGATISSASRKPLNSRLWLIRTGTKVSASANAWPSLRRAVACSRPPVSGSPIPSSSVSTSDRPSMRAAGQPNSSSAGRLQRVTAPSRSVSTKRASTSCLSSSSTASEVGAPAVAAFSDTPHFSAGTAGCSSQAVLECALHAGVERVEPVQRQCLRRAEPPARQRLRTVVREQAMRNRVQLLLGKAVQPRRALHQQLLPERHVSDERTGLGEPDLGAQGELERLPDVMQECRADQHVRVEPRVQGAGLECERGDRHRVLQQPAQVGVVTRPRAGRPPQLLPERVVCEEGIEEGAEAGVVDLARE